MVVPLLHKMQAPYNCFTLSLSGSDSRGSNFGETTMTLRWRSRCHAGDEGDHEDASVMEIMTMLR